MLLAYSITTLWIVWDENVWGDPLPLIFHPVQSWSSIWIVNSALYNKIIKGTVDTGTASPAFVFQLETTRSRKMCNVTICIHFFISFIFGSLTLFAPLEWAHLVPISSVGFLISECGFWSGSKHKVMGKNTFLKGWTTHFLLI
jgi:hypothetical protein